MTSDGLAATNTKLCDSAICRLCEPVAFTSILPYIAEKAKTLTGAHESLWQARSLAVAIVSAFHLGELVATLIWSGISDKLGRKRVLFLGFFSTAMTMLSFGFAEDPTSAVATRLLGGLTNGNAGVIDTMILENTSKDQRAYAFAIMNCVWPTGAIIGSLLGGYLSQPVAQYPTIFRPDTVWENHPYLLANLSYTLLAFLASLLLACYRDVPCRGESQPLLPSGRSRLQERKTIRTTLSRNGIGLTAHCLVA